MTRSIELARAVAETGFAHLPSLVPRPLLEQLRSAVDRLPLAGGGAYGSICHNAWRRDPAFMAAAIELELGAIACAAIAARELVWFQDHVIAKPPGGEVAIAWHQDYSYWPLDRHAGLTLWIALDDAGAEGGCLAYVAGTHRGGERRAANFAAGVPARSGAAGLEPIDDRDAGDRGQIAPVAAGDALVHHPLVWHRSGPNRGNRPRRAWSISWIDPESRWDPRHAAHPFLIDLAPAPGTRVRGPCFPRFTAET